MGARGGRQEGNLEEGTRMSTLRQARARDTGNPGKLGFDELRANESRGVMLRQDYLRGEERRGRQQSATLLYQFCTYQLFDAGSS